MVIKKSEVVGGKDGACDVRKLVPFEFHAAEYVMTAESLKC